MSKHIKITNFKYEIYCVFPQPLGYGQKEKSNMRPRHKSAERKPKIPMHTLGNRRYSSPSSRRGYRAINQQHCHVMSGYEMEMEHTHVARERANPANLFSHRQKPPQSGDSTAQLLNEIRISTLRNKPEATGCCPLGGGIEWGGLVASSCRCALENEDGYIPTGTGSQHHHTRLLLVLLSDSPAAFRRVAELSQLMRGQVMIAVSTTQ